MDIILIGSGNTATALGRKSLSEGHRIVQVYSRNEEHARRLGMLLNSETTSSLSGITKKADLMIIAVSDDAIIPFIQSIGAIHMPVAHTSGAAPLNSIKNSGDLYGVIWPLQSLRKEIEVIPPLTLLVDANKPEALKGIMSYAQTIGNIVLEADDKTRLKYHLAAAVVNNFTNYLFTVAENFCKKENISFRTLQPLIEETVMRMRNVSPAETQTGPAIRNDLLTLNKHRSIIKEYPELLPFYELFTREIQKASLNLHPEL
jgi:predicted short-subunit dehydrogenase-like oxidoreductase (DUF2520 family)